MISCKGGQIIVEMELQLPLTLTRLVCSGLWCWERFLFLRGVLGFVVSGVWDGEGLLGLGMSVEDRMCCNSGSVWWSVMLFSPKKWWYKCATVDGCACSLAMCSVWRIMCFSLVCSSSCVIVL